MGVPRGGGVMPVDLNPADTEARDQLRKELIKLRKDLGLRQKDVAARVGRIQATVALWERTTNWRMSTLTRWARALGRRIVCEVDGLEPAPPTAETAIWRATAPGFERDMALLVDTLRRTRMACGVTIADLAAVIGIDSTALAAWETCKTFDPHLTSLQRHPRALGGALRITLTPLKEEPHE